MLSNLNVVLTKSDSCCPCWLRIYQLPNWHLCCCWFYLPSWSFIPTWGSLGGAPSPNQATSLKHSCPLFLCFTVSPCACYPKSWQPESKHVNRAKLWHCHPLQEPLSHLALSLLIQFNVWSIRLLCLFLDHTWSQGRPTVARWILKSCLYWPVWGHLFTRWAPCAYIAGKRTRKGACGAERLPWEIIIDVCCSAPLWHHVNHHWVLA